VYRASRPAYFLRLSSHLKNISPSLSPHRVMLCVVRSLLRSSPLCTTSRAARLPHPAPRPLYRRAALHPPPRPLQLIARRGPSAAHRAPSAARAEVLLGCCRVPTHATVPHQKVLPAVGAMAITMCDLNKEMLR
jgi:hypothetical protein